MPLLSGIFVFTMAVVAYGKRILALILTLLAFPWTNLPKTASQQLYPYWRFFYASFLKPHTTVSTNGQRDALENFYSSQADAYDVTRAGLLKGREDMLCLAAAQLKFREDREDMPRHRIWVDVREPHSTTAMPLNLRLDWWWHWIQHRSNATIHRCANLFLSNLSRRFFSVPLQDCSTAILQARLEKRLRYLSRCKALPAAGS
jgi:hypothetical protein